ncbi:MAG TPA: ribokinase [Anaerolineaceae bacterium]|nr:ribokinase [Anaerolineaceae bacterium]
MKPDLIVVGSHAPGIFVRVKNIPKEDETVIGWDFHEPEDGGKGSNQAIAAARLGARTAFVGCVGQDRVGEEGARWMRREGVDTTWLRRDPNASSGIGFIILNDKGIPALITSMGANANITCNYVDEAFEKMRGASVLLTQFEIPTDVAIHAAKVARRLGMISIVNPAPAPSELIEGLEAASILVPNENEAKTLLGIDVNNHQDPIEMAIKLQRLSKSNCVIITLGKEGVVGSESSGETWQLVAPKVTVMDSSGAGDAFCAGLAVGLLNGMNIRSAANWGCYVAAISVSKMGTIPSFPTNKEVASFINKG